MTVVVEAYEDTYDILNEDFEPIETGMTKEEMVLWLEENEPDEVYFEQYAGVDPDASHSLEEAMEILSED